MQILDWVLSILKTTPSRWAALAAWLPAELAQRPPLAGEWSAVECLQHLIDAERQVFPARMRALLAGQDFPAFNPDTQGTRVGKAVDFTRLADEFTLLRKDNLALLVQLEEADLSRQARHQELGIVSLNELLHEWAAHDLMHTVQAERALMQPFIHACGPWQVSFKDHFA